MKINVISDIPILTDTIVIPIEQDDSYEQKLQNIATLAGVNGDLLLQDFKPSLKNIHTIYSQSETIKRVYLLGLGKAPSFNDWLSAFRSFSFKIKSKFPPNLGIYFRGIDDISMPLEAAINGMVLSQYDIHLYQTKAKNPHPLSQDAELTIYTLAQDVENAHKAIKKGGAIGRTQLKVYDLVNAPSNKKLPKTLADWAVSSGNEFGYDVTIFDKAQIEDIGLHALLAVNRGSEFKPYFIIMEYKPNDADDNLPKVGLVGKGVTYDTGGLNIKTAGMHFMKSDMGGAAAVLGTMEAAAKLQLPIHLVGIVPTTDNAVDALSIRPGDVINSYSGKTIEVIDTDAEGRLILADGLAYMVEHFQPDTLIDLATLTGSSVRTFGYKCAALFSNNDDLASRIYEAGMQTHERAWRLPIWEDYGKEMESDIADIKNLNTQPMMSGAITAAKFLQFFTSNHPRWAHLDIAGAAFGNTEFGKQKQGTAYGVRLLVKFLENLA